MHRFTNPRRLAAAVAVLALASCKAPRPPEELADLRAAAAVWAEGAHASLEEQEARRERIRRRCSLDAITMARQALGRAAKTSNGPLGWKRAAAAIKEAAGKEGCQLDDEGVRELAMDVFPTARALLLEDQRHKFAFHVGDGSDSACPKGVTPEYERRSACRIACGRRHPRDANERVGCVMDCDMFAGDMPFDAPVNRVACCDQCTMNGLNLGSDQADCWKKCGEKK